MREVNECFYLFLAGLCLTVTNNDMNNIESVGSYCETLKKMNKILIIQNFSKFKESLMLINNLGIFF